jgi:hypothetical protein
MVWFVRFGQGHTAQRRTFGTQEEAVRFARAQSGRVLVGWGRDLAE